MKYNFKALIASLALLTINYCKAQNYNARSQGLADCKITNSDAWSIINNPAGIAALDKTDFAVGFQRSYLIKELNEYSFALATPIKNKINIGIAYSQFGYSLYREQELYLALARKFGKNFQIGVTINKSKIYFTEPYSDYNQLRTSIGFQSKITEKLSLAFVGNIVINKSEVSSELNRLTNTISIGVNYKVADQCKLYIENFQSASGKLVVNAACEYQPYSTIFLRGGIGINPLKGSFGFGLIKSNYQIDVGVSRQEVLGYSPTISLHYYLHKTEK